MNKHRNFFRKTGNAILCQIKPDADLPQENELILRHLEEQECSVEAPESKEVTLTWTIQNQSADAWPKNLSFRKIEMFDDIKFEPISIPKGLEPGEVKELRLTI